MSRLRDLPEWLALNSPRIPPEILAAVFSATCESGLTVTQSLRVMESVAKDIDPGIASEIAAIETRLTYSVDRPRTYAALVEQVDSELLRQLLVALASAELSGELVVTRSRQIFESLTAQREDAVSRRAESYPLIMIVFMVLFFLPAIVILLVGPLYNSVLQVLRSIG